MPSESFFVRQAKRFLSRSVRKPNVHDLSLTCLETRSVPAIVGTVFQDFNANGVRDLTSTLANTGGGTIGTAVDRGLGGVTVTAYDDNGMVRGSTMTDDFGAYTLNVSGSQTDPLRIEFTTLPTGFGPAPIGPDNGTTVQFVPNATQANINCGLVISEDFSEDNPLLVTNLYQQGHFDGPNANEPGLIAFPYASGGSTPTNPGAAAWNIRVPFSRVGTAFGLGYDRVRRDLYNSAYFKRHAGFGPDGTGAIYRVNVPHNVSGNYSPPPGSLLFADLNTIFGVNTAGPNLHDTTDDNGNGLSDDYDTDNGNIGWDAVGKTSLGGLDVTDDGQFVFVMNLADRQLYRLPTTGTLDATTVQRVSIPLTNPNSSVITNARFRANDLRPFAVEFHRGKIYVGVVYTAETLATGPNGPPGQADDVDQTARDELLAVIYRLDPNTMMFEPTPQATFRLNHPRAGSAIAFEGAGAPPTTWEPWRPQYFRTSPNASRGVAHQPMFTGITFDAQGNLTLGIRDRGSDQTGYFSLSNPTSTTRVEGFTGGDILRATINTVNDFDSGWTLESNGRVANNITSAGGKLGNAPQNNNFGPGGAEFYESDRFAGGHHETSMGGTFQLPGFRDVVFTNMDPADDIRAGGISWTSTLTGGEPKAYQLYATTNGNAPLNTFGKANGLGELVAIVGNPPKEFGNRIWSDADGDGVQDPNEVPVGNLAVELWDLGADGQEGGADDSKVASVTTNNLGQYYFSQTKNITGKSHYAGGLALLPNRKYQVRIPNAVGGSQQVAVAGLVLSQADADQSKNGDLRDSDAVLSTDKTTAGITFNSGPLGVSSHTYDVGFAKPIMNFSLGNRVWFDANNSGFIDGGESGIDGVTVFLRNDTGSPVLDGGGSPIATTTSNGGYYRFDGLLAGDYTIAIAASDAKLVGFRSSTGAIGVTDVGGPTEVAVDPDNNIDSDDNGTLLGNFIVSLPVTLGPTDNEPVSEADLNGGQGADDKLSNMTVDFGFFRPMSLGNRVSIDLNNSGKFDAGDLNGPANVVMILLDTSGNPVLDKLGVAIATKTDSNGYYLFSGLNPGKYKVAVAASNFASGGPLVGFVSSTGGGVGSATGPNEGMASNAGDNTDSGNTSGGIVISSLVALVNDTATMGEPTAPGNTDTTTDSNSELTIDFSFFQPLSLGNRVWDDANNNGKFDVGEVALANLSVRLLDENGVAIITGGNPIATTTNSSGYYIFNNLTSGKYIVEVVPPTGYVSSTGKSGSTSGGFEPGVGTGSDDQDHGTTLGNFFAPTTVRSKVVILTPGAATTDETGGVNITDGALDANSEQTIDFGLFRPLSLGNRVWIDANNDGQFNAGEAAAFGVVVELLDSSGNPLLDGSGNPITATTNSQGFYLFTGLGAGQYKVAIASSNFAGAGKLIGFASSTGGVNGMGLNEGMTVNAGNNKDSGNTSGTLGSGGRVISSTVSLAAATQSKNEEGVNGNTPGIIDPAADANSEVTIDFGFYQPLRLGNLVWNDVNNSGTVSTGEVGIASVIVNLFRDGDGDGVPDSASPIGSVKTDTNGQYLFSGLGIGQYIVALDPATFPTGFWISSTGKTGSATGVSEPAPSPDNDTDNDDNGSSTSGQIRSGTVTLTSAGEPDSIIDGDDRGGNLTVDFGIFQPLSLGNLVWNDLNNNGMFDTATETGIADRSVRLYADSDDNGIFEGGTDQFVTSSKTNSSGHYLFTNLAPGGYFVQVDGPESYLSSSGKNGSLSGPNEPAPSPNTDANTDDNGTTLSGTVTTGITAISGLVTLSVGGEPTNDDATTPGISDNTPHTNSNTSVDFGFYQPMSLGNQVWNDSNNNGKLDAGEVGIDSLTLNLFTPDGKLVSTTTTDAQGFYLFTNLVPGDYLVELIAPAGFVSSTGGVNGTGPYESANTPDPDTTFDRDDNGTQITLALIRSGTITLVRGDEPTGEVAGSQTDTATDASSNLTLDFGLFQPLSLGNFVWNDANNSGTFDANEGRLDGVTVNLYRDTNNDGTPDGGINATTTTNGDGSYLFIGLGVGNYIVEVDGRTLPAGYWVSSSGKNASATGPNEGTATPDPDTANTNHVDIGDTFVRNANSFLVRSKTIELTLGNEPTNDGATPGITDTAFNANSNVTADFGFYQPLSLGNSVWNDANNNGMFDSGEAKMSGLTVNLLSADRATTVASTTTNANGEYLFTLLSPGDYVVEVIAPTGFTSSTGKTGFATGPNEPGPNPNTNLSDLDDNGTRVSSTVIRSGIVTLSVGAEPTSESQGSGINDPAADANSNLTVDFGLFEPLSLGNQVWLDTNNDGKFDTTEKGAIGVLVRLLDAMGKEVATTTTDGDGKYLFRNLGSGGYRVEITAPAGFTSSTGKDSSLVGPFETAPNDDTNSDDAGTANTVGGTVFTSGLVTLVANTEPIDDSDTDSDTNLSIDFGIVQLLNLGNQVWNDVNNNGKLDAGESGISGVTVNLYQDTNQDGTPDTAAPYKTFTTDADGKYLFGGLIAGGYVVEVVNPTGFVPSSGKNGDILSGPFQVAPSPNTDIDNDDNGTITAGGKVTSSAVVLSQGGEPTQTTNTGDTNLTVDFGYFQPLSLGNQVWNDADNNGKLDAGEQQLSGVEVRLYDAVGSLIGTTTTDGAGKYLFTNLIPGQYSVEVTPPIGFISSTGKSGFAIGPNEPAASPDNNTDSLDDGNQISATIVRSGSVTLSLGDEPTSTTNTKDTNLTVDFGLFRPLSLGNLVWFDKNNNGNVDGGEKGVSGVMVRLLDANGNEIVTATTDADGKYLFTNLGNGDYRVEITAPTGFTSSTGQDSNLTGPFESAPNDETNNDDAGTALTLGGNILTSGLITLAPNTEPTEDGDADSDSNLTADFGIIPLMSLGNLVWNDLNNNGTFDAGEKGLGGVAVNLYLDANQDGVPDTANPYKTVTTDANGNYAFVGLIPGGYIVEVVDPLGYVPSSGKNGDILSGPFQVAPSPNTDIDNDDNGTISTTGRVVSGTVILTASDEPTNDGDTNNQSNFSVDFGYFQPLTLGNLVWNDTNNDGLVSVGESGLPNVPVRLFDALGKFVASTTTTVDGDYGFTNLVPGDYTVEVDLPSGFTSSTGGVNGAGPFETAPNPNDDINSDDNGTILTGQTVRSTLVTLTRGGEPGTTTNPNDANFTVDFGAFQPLSLGNLVWNDINNNGIFDASEQGISGVTVNLHRDSNKDGVPDATTPHGTTITNATGNYLFTGLGTDNYVVAILAPVGFLSSSGKNGFATGPNETAPLADSNLDLDDNGNTISGSVIRSSTIALAPFTEPTGEGATSGLADSSPDNSSNVTVDFGLYQPLSLGDLVWNDVNNNGTVDSGEMGVANVAVALVKDGVVVATTATDTNGNYLFTNLNPGEYFVEITAPVDFISSTGKTGFSTGPNEVAPTSNTNTDNDDNGNQVSPTLIRSTAVTLSVGSEPSQSMNAGDTNLTVDFGIFEPLSLGNQVWFDVNNNGQFDATEMGVTVVSVRLLDANGTEVATTSTDAAGKYLFENLGVGSYRVAITAPTGYVSTTGQSSSLTGPFEMAPNDETNSDDAGTGTTIITSGLVILAPNTEPITDGDTDSDSNLSIDFGIVQLLNLGNLVWNDLNNNGLVDATEKGIAGVTVNLYQDANQDGTPDTVAPYKSLTTDANGNYTFTGLVAGGYVVEVVDPTGFVPSSGKNGDILSGPYQIAPSPNTDIDRDDNGTIIAGGKARTSTVILSDKSEPSQTTSAGDTNLTVDFGYFQPLTLGNLVWNDRNNDGVVNVGETGVANVAVRLLNNGVVVTTTTTGPNGEYRFTNLNPGNYVVEITPPLGFVSSTGAANGVGPFETAPNPNGNIDDDDNGTTAGTVIRSQPITLTVGDEPVNGRENPTVDFGVLQPLSLGNLVWNDANNNGRFDVDEKGLGGVTINLYRDDNVDGQPDGLAIGSLVTSSDGKYLFTQLGEGSFVVEVLSKTIPTGMVSSSGATGKLVGPFEMAPNPNSNFDSDDNGTSIGLQIRSQPVTLTLGAEPTDGNTNTTVDFGFFQPLSFGNTVWRDDNNNGKLDPNEPVLPNIPVKLFDADGKLIAETITNTDGTYRFDNLNSGGYSVEITPPTGVLPSDLVFNPFGGNDNVNIGKLASGGTIRSQVIQLEPGQGPLVGGNTNPNNFVIGDFGLLGVAKLSGFVYRDPDNNGTFDTNAGDTPLGGVTIRIEGVDLAGNALPTRTTTTDVTGFYQFTELVPGTYTINEVQPGGILYDGIDTVGNLGGSTTNDRHTVRLDPNADGRNYNFGEIPPSSVFGNVYVDRDLNGLRNGTEVGISGVPITIRGTAFVGTPLARPLTPADVLGGLTVFTDANGRYAFPLLPPGQYTLTEDLQPNNFLDGMESNRDPQVPADIGNEILSGIVATPNGIHGPFDFGEITPDPTKRNFLASSNTVSPTATVRGNESMLPAFSVTSGNLTGSAFVVTAVGAGMQPLIRVFDYATGGEKFRFLAYETTFTGGVRVATGDFNGDGIDDILTGIGVGGGPRIRVFDGTDGSPIYDFLAYEETFRGGLFVAAGDINGDGADDIVTGVDTGGGPRVRVLDGKTLAVIQDAFAFDPNQRGGVRVAADDINGDGKDDLVVTTGPTVETRVRVFNGLTMAMLRDFSPFETGFRGGVNIAAGDVNGDGIADIVTGAETGGASRVQVFSGLTLEPLASFFAYDPIFRGGVRVATQDVNGDGKAELITSPATGMAGRIRILTKAGAESVDEFTAFDPEFTGGVYVG